MPDLQIPLAGLGILHHDGGHVREAARGQRHGGRAHEHRAHDQHIGPRLGHPLADLVHQREDDERGDGVADEAGDHEDQDGEDDEHAVQAEALDALRDARGDGVQQAGGVDGFAEGEAAGSEDDDSPEEVVEVFLGEDAGAEEDDEGDDGYNAHVAEDWLELMCDAPEEDGQERHAANEVLCACEAVLHRADGDDGGAAAGLEREQQEEPDQ